MASESPGFFSDPKVVIAILALVISLASLLWSAANQWEQNRRWDALNAGTLTIMQPNLTIWKELTKAEAQSTDWGYEPTIYGAEVGAKFRLPYFLQLREVASGKPIPQANPVFTRSEVLSEIKRLGLETPPEVLKTFRVNFFLENTGKTAVRDAHVEVDVRMPPNEWASAFRSNTLIDVEPSTSITISFDVGIPIGRKLPEFVSYRLRTRHKTVHGTFEDKEIDVAWSQLATTGCTARDIPTRASRSLTRVVYTLVRSQGTGVLAHGG